MRIGFIVNDVRTEEATYTTTRLAVAAINRAHEVWTIGVGDLEIAWRATCGTCKAPPPAPSASPWMILTS